MKLTFMIIVLLAILPLVNALTLTVNSPEDIVYNSTSVLFSLEADSRSYFYYSNVDDSGRWIKLCNEKSRVCEKKVRAREGVNNFEVKAVSGEEFDTKQVTFTIDSKKPKITKTFPSRNAVTNGSLFFIQYTEENLEEGILHYGEDSVTGECEAGINKQCRFSLTSDNLSDYDGEEIEYWFEVSDEVNTVLSKRTKIKIDINAPEILSEQYLQDGKKMKFVFDIEEKNFDRIFYKDTSDCLPENEASGLLCSTLRDGRCVVTKSFCEGGHNLTITVTDKAGNSAVTDTEFTVNGV